MLDRIEREVKAINLAPSCRFIFAGEANQIRENFRFATVTAFDDEEDSVVDVCIPNQRAYLSMRNSRQYFDSIVEVGKSFCLSQRLRTRSV